MIIAIILFGAINLSMADLGPTQLQDGSYKGLPAVDLSSSGVTNYFYLPEQANVIGNDMTLLSWMKIPACTSSPQLFQWPGVFKIGCTLFTSTQTTFQVIEIKGVITPSPLIGTFENSNWYMVYLRLQSNNPLIDITFSHLSPLIQSTTSITIPTVSANFVSTTPYIEHIANGAQVYMFNLALWSQYLSDSDMSTLNWNIQNLNSYFINSMLVNYEVKLTDGQYMYMVDFSPYGMVSPTSAPLTVIRDPEFYNTFVVGTYFTIQSVNTDPLTALKMEVLQLHTSKIKLDVPTTVNPQPTEGTFEIWFHKTIGALTWQNILKIETLTQTDRYQLAIESTPPVRIDGLFPPNPPTNMTIYNTSLIGKWTHCALAFSNKARTDVGYHAYLQCDDNIVFNSSDVQIGVRQATKIKLNADSVSYERLKLHDFRWWSVMRTSYQVRANRVGYVTSGLLLINYRLVRESSEGNYLRDYAQKYHLHTNIATNSDATWVTETVASHPHYMNVFDPSIFLQLTGAGKTADFKIQVTEDQNYAYYEWVYVDTPALTGCNSDITKFGADSIGLTDVSGHHKPTWKVGGVANGTALPDTHKNVWINYQVSQDYDSGSSFKRFMIKETVYNIASLPATPTSSPYYINIFFPGMLDCLTVAKAEVRLYDLTGEYFTYNTFSPYQFTSLNGFMGDSRLLHYYQFQYFTDQGLSLVHNLVDHLSYFDASAFTFSSLPSNSIQYNGDFGYHESTPYKQQSVFITQLTSEISVGTLEGFSSGFTFMLYYMVDSYPGGTMELLSMDYEAKSLLYQLNPALISYDGNNQSDSNVVAGRWIQMALTFKKSGSSLDFVAINRYVEKSIVTTSATLACSPQSSTQLTNVKLMVGSVAYTTSIGRIRSLAILDQYIGAQVDYEFMMRQFTWEAQMLERTVNCGYCRFYLFNNTDVQNLVYDYGSTSDNGPMFEYLNTHSQHNYLALPEGRYESETQHMPLQGGITRVYQNTGGQEDFKGDQRLELDFTSYQWKKLINNQRIDNDVNYALTQATSIDQNTLITFCVWVNFISTPSNSIDSIFQFSESASSPTHHLFYQSGTQLVLRMEGVANSTVYPSSPQIGNWVHMSVVRGYSPGLTKFVMNSIDKTLSISNPTTPLVINGNILIGPIPAYIHQFQLFSNTALTNTQIMDTMLGTTKVVPLIDWKFGNQQYRVQEIPNLALTFTVPNEGPDTGKVYSQVSTPRSNLAGVQDSHVVDTKVEYTHQTQLLSWHFMFFMYQYSGEGVVVRDLNSSSQSEWMDLQLVELDHEFKYFSYSLTKNGWISQKWLQVQVKYIDSGINQGLYLFVDDYSAPIVQVSPTKRIEAKVHTLDFSNTNIHVSHLTLFNQYFAISSGLYYRESRIIPTRLKGIIDFYFDCYASSVIGNLLWEPGFPTASGKPRSYQNGQWTVGSEQTVTSTFAFTNEFQTTPAQDMEAAGIFRDSGRYLRFAPNGFTDVRIPVAHKPTQPQISVEFYLFCKYTQTKFDVIKLINSDATHHIFSFEYSGGSDIFEIKDQTLAIFPITPTDTSSNWLQWMKIKFATDSSTYSCFINTFVTIGSPSGLPSPNLYEIVLSPTYNASENLFFSIRDLIIWDGYDATDPGWAIKVSRRYIAPSGIRHFFKLDDNSDDFTIKDEITQLTISLMDASRQRKVYPAWTNRHDFKLMGDPNVLCKSGSPIVYTPWIHCEASQKRVQGFQTLNTDIDVSMAESNKVGLQEWTFATFFRIFGAHTGSPGADVDLMQLTISTGTSTTQSFIFYVKALQANQTQISLSYNIGTLSQTEVEYEWIQAMVSYSQNGYTLNYYQNGQVFSEVLGGPLLHILLDTMKLKLPSPSTEERKLQLREVQVFSIPMQYQQFYQLAKSGVGRFNSDLAVYVKLEGNSFVYPMSGNLIANPSTNYSPTYIYQAREREEQCNSPFMVYANGKCEYAPQRVDFTDVRTHSLTKLSTLSSEFSKTGEVQLSVFLIFKDAGPTQDVETQFFVLSDLVTLKMIWVSGQTNRTYRLYTGGTLQAELSVQQHSNTILGFTVDTHSSELKFCFWDYSTTSLTCNTTSVPTLTFSSNSIQLGGLLNLQYKSLMILNEAISPYSIIQFRLHNSKLNSADPRLVAYFDYKHSINNGTYNGFIDLISHGSITHSSTAYTEASDSLTSNSYTCEFGQIQLNSQRCVPNRHLQVKCLLGDPWTIDIPDQTGGYEGSFGFWINKDDQGSNLDLITLENFFKVLNKAGGQESILMLIGDLIENTFSTSVGDNQWVHEVIVWYRSATHNSTHDIYTVQSSLQIDSFNTTQENGTISLTGIKILSNVGESLYSFAHIFLLSEAIEDHFRYRMVDPQGFPLSTYGASLLAYFSMDESSGASITDSVTNSAYSIGCNSYRWVNWAAAEPHVVGEDLYSQSGEKVASKKLCLKFTAATRLAESSFSTSFNYSIISGVIYYFPQTRVETPTGISYMTRLVQNFELAETIAREGYLELNGTSASITSSLTYSTDQWACVSFGIDRVNGIMYLYISQGTNRAIDRTTSGVDLTIPPTASPELVLGKQLFGGSNPDNSVQGLLKYLKLFTHYISPSDMDYYFHFSKGDRLPLSLRGKDMYSLDMDQVYGGSINYRGKAVNIADKAWERPSVDLQMCRAEYYFNTATQSCVRTRQALKLTTAISHSLGSVTGLAISLNFWVHLQSVAENTTLTFLSGNITNRIEYTLSPSTYQLTPTGNNRTINTTYTSHQSLQWWFISIRLHTNDSVVSISRWHSSDSWTISNFGFDENYTISYSTSTGHTLNLDPQLGSSGDMLIAELQLFQYFVSDVVMKKRFNLKLNSEALPYLVLYYPLDESSGTLFFNRANYQSGIAEYLTISGAQWVGTSAIKGGSLDDLDCRNPNTRMIGGRCEQLICTQCPSINGSSYLHCSGHATTDCHIQSSSEIEFFDSTLVDAQNCSPRCSGCSAPMNGSLCSTCATGFMKDPNSDLCLEAVVGPAVCTDFTLSMSFEGVSSEEGKVVMNLVFSQELKLTIPLTSSDIKFQFTGPYYPYGTTPSMAWSGNKTIKVSISHSKEFILSDETIGVTLQNYELFQSNISCLEQQKYEYSIYTKKKKLTLQAQQAAMMGSVAGNTSWIAILISIFLTVLVGASMELLWSFINTMQIILYMPLLIDYYPQHVTAQINFFKFANFEFPFLQDFYESMLNLDLLDNSVAVPKFEQNDIESMKIVKNLGSILLTFMAFMLIIPIIFLIRRLVCRKLRRTRRKIRKCAQGYKYNFFLRLLSESYLEVYFFAYLNLSHLSVNNYLEGISSLLSIYLTIYMFMVPLAVPLFSHVNRDNIQEGDIKFMQQFSEYYADFKRGNIHFYSYFFLRRFILVFMIINQTVPLILQLTLFHWTSVLVQAYLILYRPFESHQMNFINIVNECLILFISYANMAFTYQDYQFKLKCGWAVNYFILAIVVLNIAFAIGSPPVSFIISKIMSKFKHPKKVKPQQTTVQKLTLNESQNQLKRPNSAEELRENNYEDPTEDAASIQIENWMPRQKRNQMSLTSGTINNNSENPQDGPDHFDSQVEEIKY